MKSLTAVNINEFTLFHIMFGFSYRRVEILGKFARRLDMMLSRSMLYVGSVSFFSTIARDVCC